MPDHAHKLLIPPLIHTTPITSFSLVSEVRSTENSATSPFDLLIQTATRQWDLNSRLTTPGYSKPVLKDVTPPSILLPPLGRVSESSVPLVPVAETYKSVTSSFFPNEARTVFASEPRSSSPTFGAVVPKESDGAVAPGVPAVNTDYETAKPVAETVLASFSARSQRQRTGPSCHACRSRKIKCDAQMIVISASSANDPVEPESLISPSRDETSIDSWIDGCQLLGESKESNEWLIFRVEPISSESFYSEEFKSAEQEIILIKFKKCTACAKKNCSCFFDKGFNRLDVERFKQSEPETITPAPKTEKPEMASRKRRNTDENLSSNRSDPGGQRRSSCNGCRSRKIKCVKRSSESKCVHCLRRDIECAMP
ncbi:unnamed protein product [Kuraishia capsulata CBS 1993]|uniref:Zn(2)-C6 fungal-type domain-containing protein n=1 Tax=Kuraishia capsulata CBS 1993 TaxID=1382522 RepID=W6MP69_9ASCO|nr:uncharacterized protein KUCA_T00004039001 [Kuraishia capsulata CBS 1993]CDK28058.1 unnamed protein product [Kuraishia capsulata CBS 1993]